MMHHSVAESISAYIAIQEPVQSFHSIHSMHLAITARKTAVSCKRSLGDCVPGDGAGVDTGGGGGESAAGGGGGGGSAQQNPFDSQTAILYLVKSILQGVPSGMRVIDMCMCACMCVCACARGLSHVHTALLLICSRCFKKHSHGY